MTGAVVVAGFFSLIAGLCAYLITLEEAQRHFPTRRRQQLEALRTGFVAMLFFLLLAVALGFALSGMFGGGSSSPSGSGSGLRRQPGHELGGRGALAQQALDVAPRPPEGLEHGDPP